MNSQRTQEYSTRILLTKWLIFAIFLPPNTPRSAQPGAFHGSSLRPQPPQAVRDAAVAPRYLVPRYRNHPEDRSGNRREGSARRNPLGPHPSGARQRPGIRSGIRSGAVWGAAAPSDRHRQPTRCHRITSESAPMARAPGASPHDAGSAGDCNRTNRRAGRRPQRHPASRQRDGRRELSQAVE